MKMGMNLLSVVCRPQVHKKQKAATAAAVDMITGVGWAWSYFQLQA